MDDVLPKNAWRLMLTVPRRTIHAIVSHDPGLHVVPLLCLNGIAQSLEQVATNKAGNGWSLAAILGLAIVFGSLGGVVHGWLMSHLLRITGRWLGGTAERRHLLAAFAWAAVPSVLGLVLWIPQFAVAGKDVFCSLTPRMDASEAATTVVTGCRTLQLMLAFWSLLLAGKAVAEVQGFRSAWAGFGNMLLAFLLFPGLLFVVVAIVAGLGPLVTR